MPQKAEIVNVTPIIKYTIINGDVAPAISNTPCKKLPIVNVVIPHTAKFEVNLLFFLLNNVTVSPINNGYRNI